MQKANSEQVPTGVYSMTQKVASVMSTKENLIMQLIIIYFVKKNCFRLFELIKIVPNNYGAQRVCE